MNKKHLFLVIALLACVGLASAQNRKALRINEVMVTNDNGFVDEYGHRHGWIELFNSNYGPLEISSVYITNDPNNPTKYPVPMGDESTHMGKRQHIVFYADDEPNLGPLHLSFQLAPGQDNWIGIYDADGKTLIDEVVVPAALAPNQSYARTVDGEGEWEIRNGGDKYITPKSANKIKDTNNKIQLFAEYDGHGFGMAAMAMCIVFSALLVLCLAFMAIDRIGQSAARHNKAKAHGVQDSAEKKSIEHDSGEVIAAICMAMYQHLNAHDTESTVLTINKVKRAYSPWSSKIYGLRQLPH
ncbi:MAG: OadG family protein [Bacteroidales bacterium]|nr:OadG family protein [Bacteroidales bacterium]